MGTFYLLLLCGIILAPRPSLYPAAEKVVPTLTALVPVNDNNCWIFLHLPKSGGSTVKTIIKRRFRRSYANYDDSSWKKGGDFLDSFGQTLADDGKQNVICGAYAEALGSSSAADQACQWYTVFRHPITRLVSAYYYCHKRPVDKLCSSSILNAKDVDLTTFAKHWSNFAMRQFAFGQVSVDSVMKYVRTDAVRAQLPPNVQQVEDVSGLHLIKMYLDGQGWGSDHAEIPDVAMHAMMQPVQNLLHDRYTVGILEEFNTTLSLFSASLMPGVDWNEQYSRSGKVNVDRKYIPEVEASLRQAWASSEIQKYMQLDLVLYNYALDLFREQTRAYGIEQ